MPHSESAKKRVRQNRTRAEKNKALRTALRTAERKVRAAVEAGDKAAAEAGLQVAYQRIDKAAKRNVVHANTAANHKRRLARSVSRLPS